MLPQPTRIDFDADDRERALVERLRAGDQVAYAEIVRTLGPRLLATARRLLRDEEEARDVVQETFLSAFRALDRFSGEAKLSTWLQSIATNAALMRLRRSRRHPELSLDDLQPQVDAVAVLDESSAWDPPADALESRRLRAAVRRSIERLPASHRSVIVLREVEDRSTAEAARSLGITAGAVKLRLHRARLALRPLLETELADPLATTA
jgi:RNA polymerase sigma-70 factor, ECF subfamily